jgi:hypothetical protein
LSRPFQPILRMSLIPSDWLHPKLFAGIAALQHPLLLGFVLTYFLGLRLVTSSGSLGLIKIRCFVFNLTSVVVLLDFGINELDF